MERRLFEKCTRNVGEQCTRRAAEYNLKKEREGGCCTDTMQTKRCGFPRRVDFTKPGDNVQVAERSERYFGRLRSSGVRFVFSPKKRFEEEAA